MNLNELGRLILDMYRPPSDETVSQWADNKRVITGKGAAEPGPWHTDRAPYQREIMDAFTQKGVHDIAMMCCAQAGKTDMVLNMIGRAMELDPGPMLMVFPAEDDCLKFSKERLQPTIDATPTLARLVFGGNGSTILQKNFPNGFLSLTGAISPGGLKSRPIRYLFMDEVDGYPASAGVQAHADVFQRDALLHEHADAEIRQPYLQAVQEGHAGGMGNPVPALRRIQRYRIRGHIVRQGGCLRGRNRAGVRRDARRVALPEVPRRSV